MFHKMNLSAHFYVFVTLALIAGSIAVELVKDEVDKVVENEITEKLTEDLIQSLERKFQVDLEKSVDMVLVKIKYLLENGTNHVQEKINVLQKEIDSMKQKEKKGVEKCMKQWKNESAVLAEKALHQMVLCGYALIGHDPAQALMKVLDLKQKIKNGLKPVSENRPEIFGLLKLCGHEHDSLKKVVKCVISKSPLIKSSMMEVTNSLIGGVVDLTKLMAHGAMHEACLIEVVKSVEDVAFTIVSKVKRCAFNTTQEETLTEFDKYIKEDNATVLDLGKKEPKHIGKKEDVNEMKTLIRRMLDNGESIDKHFKKKLRRIEKDLNAVDGKD